LKYIEYIDKYHPSIKDCLKKYPNFKKRIKEKIDYIIKNPFCLGEPLKYNLKGLRSFPFANNFLIIYIICEECRRLQYQKINKCGMNCSKIPKNTIIFLYFGCHDTAYRIEKYKKRKNKEQKEYRPFT